MNLCSALDHLLACLHRQTIVTAYGTISTASVRRTVVWTAHDV